MNLDLLDPDFQDLRSAFDETGSIVEVNAFWIRGMTYVILWSVVGFSWDLYDALEELVYLEAEVGFDAPGVFRLWFSFI